MLSNSSSSEPRCDEAQLIARIVQQDQIALSQLYDRYARVIYAVAYKSLSSVEECEEVVLDVFAQVWRTADRYDAKRARVDTWLFMMARSRVLDRLRGRQRRDKVTDAVISLDPPTAKLSPGPAEHVEIVERRSIVVAALEGIPPEQRLVLELSYYQGLSHGEIAAQTGLALGTVKTRIRLGLEKLRVTLQGLNWDAT
jgi:RNA polymerase sigma factor (sigma-70 family)